MLTAAIALALASSAAAADPADPWLADLATLEAGLAHNYANFEHQLTVRYADLPAVHAAAEASIRAATTDDDRKAALLRVIRALRDPHVHTSPLAETDGGPPSPACPTGAQFSPGIKWSATKAFTPVEGRTFAVGTLTRSDGVKLGVIRITTFVTTAYAEACAEAAKSLAIEATTPCDETCSVHLQKPLFDNLTRRLRDDLALLESTGAAALVVDVTDNPGGEDWAEIAARVLAGPLPGAPVQLLRHPAWATEINQRIAELDAARRSARGERRSALDAARSVAASALAEVGKPCDLSAAWRDKSLSDGSRALPCTNLVAGTRYSTGFVAEPTRTPDPGGLLFALSDFDGWQGAATRLPLIVLVNRETHSSAEQMAARLQDFAGAMLAGATSAGAGCGWASNVDNSIALPTAGLRVHVPDCVRLRRDGSSERAGITPDIVVAWGPSDSPHQAALRMWDALDRASLK